MTVLEVIQKSTEFLANKGVDSPRLQIESLLSHVLKMPRMKLYLNFDRVLKPEEIELVRALVKRRGNREPLQHIVGSTSFCGIEIAVNPHVLIPRPETEMLAERGWKFLNSVENPESLALDFATGSGCIAIALAVNCAKAKIHALDVSPDALGIARQNADTNKVADRIVFHQSDAFAALPNDLRFDLIVSNPPYIPHGEIAALDPEVRDFDPRQALVGGDDGLNFYRLLARQARAFLSPGGKIMMEFGDGQAPAISQIFQNEKWTVEAVEKDLTGRERILIATL